MAGFNLPYIRGPWKDKMHNENYRRIQRQFSVGGSGVSGMLVATAGTPQTIANSTTTTLLEWLEVADLAPETFDDFGGFDQTTGIFTTEDAGYYGISASVAWPSDPGNAASIFIVGSGVGPIYGNTERAGSFVGQASVAYCYLAAATDVYVRVVQNSGGNLDCTGQFFSIVKF